MKMVASFRVTKELADKCKVQALENLSHERLKDVLQKHGDLWWLAGAVLAKQGKAP